MNKGNMAKVMAQKSLLAYSVSQDSKFETPDHLKKLSALLEKVESGQIKRLIVCMPPRHGKSLLSTQMFPSWFLGKNPNKRIISASYNASLSQDFGRKVKNLMSSESYHSVFPDSKISKDSHSSSKLSLDLGGEYFAVGVGGTLTGRGADLILIDDLIKNADEARSIEHQKKLAEWYQSTLLTRLMPNGAIVIVMTRWSANDPVGWLLENDKSNQWTTLIMPAISDGIPLWPERYDLETLLSRKNEMGSKMFEALYQQKPNSEEGNLIKRDQIHFHNKQFSDMDQTIISIDTSFTNNRSSDYCVMSVIGTCYKTGEYYLLDVVREKMNFPQALKKIKHLALKYPNSQFLIEKSANGFALYDMLKNEDILVTQITPVGSKQDRLYNLVPHFESRKIFFLKPEFNTTIPDCIEEIVSFPYSKNDDFCDSFAQGIIHFTKSKYHKFINEILNYEEPINNDENDYRKILWPEHDWELEDSNQDIYNPYEKIY